MRTWAEHHPHVVLAFIGATILVLFWLGSELWKDESWFLWGCVTVTAAMQMHRFADWWKRT